MKSKFKHEAQNLRQECDPTECLTCPYFDMDIGRCSAGEKSRAAGIAQMRSPTCGWTGITI